MKSAVIPVTKDIKKNELKPGDHVAYICCLWDPLISTGTVTKIYDTDPDTTSKDPVSEFWNVKATILDDNSKRLCPNIQIRRIIKLTA